MSLCVTSPVCWVLPKTYFPLSGINEVEQRIIAIFFLAALCWIFEPIPIHATSILIITLELFLVSDAGWSYIKPQSVELLDDKEIMATFASPIILLFLGGFFLAKAATKSTFRDAMLASLKIAF